MVLLKFLLAAICRINNLDLMNVIKTVLMSNIQKF